MKKPCSPYRIQSWIKKTNAQTIASLLVISLLFGCSDDFKRSPVALISPDSQHGYTIQLDYSYLSYGGPCNLTLKSQKISESDWLFVGITNGGVSAEHLTLWHGKSPNDEFGWAVSNLVGSITFSNGSMHIDFQVPVYGDNDSILRHDPYRMNGDYKLEGK